MLSDLVALRGESVYKISKGSGVPYTTLNEIVLNKKNPRDISARTLNALADYFEIPMELLYHIMLEPSGKTAETSLFPASNWDDARRKKYQFPVIAVCDAYDASRIHPLKQYEALHIYAAICSEPAVASLILFGSSVSIRCGHYSDVDVAVALKEGCRDNETRNRISEIIQEACGYDADIVWMDRVEEGSALSRNIERGVHLK